MFNSAVVFIYMIKKIFSNQCQIKILPLILLLHAVSNIYIPQNSVSPTFTRYVLKKQNINAKKFFFLFFPDLRLLITFYVHMIVVITKFTYFCLKQLKNAWQLLGADHLDSLWDSVCRPFFLFTPIYFFLIIAQDIQQIFFCFFITHKFCAMLSTPMHDARSCSYFTVNM